jgi:hypothetical protein
MTIAPEIRAEQREIATELAPLLRRLADACEQAAEGDEPSRRLLEHHTDGYWFALTIGRGKVQRLTTDEE